MLNLRPKNLNEFVGKENLKRNLAVFINSAKTRNTCMDHLFLYGVAGTGKTSIAFIVANEFDKKLKIIQGTQLKKVTDIINFISLVCDNDVLFIDEIHAMSEECSETLYSILEDFSIDVTIGKNNNQKTARVALPKFTLIGATTNPAKLPKSLEERFGITLFFDIYSPEEIFEIAKKTNNIIESNLTDEDLYIISEHSKGVPRIANHLVKRITDYRISDAKISAKEIMSKLEIFEDGLQKVDIKYLKALACSDDYIGVKTLSSILEMDINLIENKIEPFLIRNEFIKKSNRGRTLTYKGNMYINKISLQNN